MFSYLILSFTHRELTTVFKNFSYCQFLFYLKCLERNLPNHRSKISKITKSLDQTPLGSSPATRSDDLRTATAESVWEQPNTELSGANCERTGPTVDEWYWWKGKITSAQNYLEMRRTYIHSYFIECPTTPVMGEYSPVYLILAFAHGSDRVEPHKL